MNTAPCNASGTAPLQTAEVVAAESRPLHRLASVRKLQGVSRRTMARRLNVDIEHVRQQENEMADLPLSVLYAWQKALDVPISELLIEANESLSPPILRRSQLVRLMKTVLAMHVRSRQKSIRRMAQTMCNQLIEIMPELAHISPWQAVGKRRRQNDLGVAAQRRLADALFINRDA